jgi:tetratricopeptide (TPR) repeat protein
MARHRWVLAGLLIATGPARAQTLGQLEFPNSGNAAAQAPFLRGLALLHSFEYDDAAQAFRQAQSADSSFALAYWGEAMTFTHPLWNQQDTAAAAAVLRRLGATSEMRLARAPTARERGYLQVAEALYFGDAGKARRDTLACLALERLARDYPDDLDAGAFYALWLMGLSQGVRNVPTYMRAGAIAEAIYRRNPRHPGALHYIIHAFDDPVHAPLGLHAAREYSVIAADADHAQHMTTHIFLAMGMWEETVRQNAIASGPDTTRWRPGHYTSWLGYGLMQQGKFAAARRHLDLVRRNLPPKASVGQQGYLLSMRAHYLINTERWDDGVARWTVEAPLAGPVPRAMDTYALAVAALRTGRRGDAERSLAALELLARGAPDNSYGGNDQVPSVLASQLRALLLWERGWQSQALDTLRTAAAREDGFPAEFGPPDIVKPTHELLGELLLRQNRPAEAQREFTRALELAPRRLRSLLGLASAAAAAGDTAVAARLQGDLVTLAAGADPDVLTTRRF